VPEGEDDDDTGEGSVWSISVDGVRLSAGRQALQGEFPNRLEHPVASSELRVESAEEALVEQRLQPAGISLCHTVGGLA
jgi:hypothetical protein